MPPPKTQAKSQAEQRKETWASVALIYQEVFDVRGVLAGRKSLRDLKGLREVFLGFGMVRFGSLWARF